MKYLRVIILSGLLAGVAPAFAADDSLPPSDTKNYVGYIVILSMLALLAIAMLTVRWALRLTRRLLKQIGYSEDQINVQMNKEEVWNKLLSLRPLSEESELVMDHEYDEIKELDNPIPAWFSYLFYATIIFAISYILIYPVLKIGPNQYQEYQTEVKEADIAKKIYLSKAGVQVDENTVKLVNDPAVITSGGAIFKQYCVACHGDQAQGNVGPNLTDDYWLHGGKVGDLFKTVKYGVLTKGMPTWEKVLSPKQISDVVNYVKSLHGTDPPNPKAPQGDKETDDATPAPAKNQLTVTK